MDQRGRRIVEPARVGGGGIRFKLKFRETGVTERITDNAEEAPTATLPGGDAPVDTTDTVHSPKDG